jgi:hypothetical protein
MYLFIVLETESPRLGSPTGVTSGEVTMADGIHV